MFSQAEHFGGFTVNHKFADKPESLHLSFAGEHSSELVVIIVRDRIDEQDFI